MTAALLLAAGRSTRMGRPKLDLDLGGTPMWRRSLRALREAGVEEIRVVIGGGSQEPGDLPPGVFTVVNPSPAEGLSSSIRCGLSALPASVDAVLLALADKPLIRPATIVAVVSRFRETGAPLVYPTYRGLQGHPVLVYAALFPDLRALRGDRGAKALLERGAAEAVPVDDEGVLLDIDTPEDYAEAVRCLGRTEAHE